MKEKGKRKVVALPYMGKYYVPFKYFVTHAFHDKVFVAPKKTESNLESSMGSTCMNFLNTYEGWIESLEKGATVLLQLKNWCPHPDFCKLQVEYLKEQRYAFETILFSIDDKFQWYRLLKQMGKKISIILYFKYIRITKYMVKAVLKIEMMIRERIGFEVEKGSFENLEREMLHQFLKVKSLKELKKCFREYEQKIKNVTIAKSQMKYHVALIGRIDATSEFFSAYQLEKILAKKQISVDNFPQVYIFTKERKKKTCVKNRDLQAVDGVIHIQPWKCPYEIVESILLKRKCEKEGISLLSFTYHEQMTVDEIERDLDFFIEEIKKRGT